KAGKRSSPQPKRKEEKPAGPTRTRPHLRTPKAPLRRPEKKRKANISSSLNEPHLHLRVRFFLWKICGNVLEKIAKIVLKAFRVWGYHSYRQSRFTLQWQP